MTNLSGPSHHLVEAGKNAIASAETIADPIDRAQALAQAIAVAGDLQRTIGTARAAAIRSALETRTATSVAAELGISRQRLYQILDDLAPVDPRHPDNPFAKGSQGA